MASNAEISNGLLDFEDLGSKDLPFDFELATLAPLAAHPETLDFDLLAGADSLDSLSSMSNNSSNNQDGVIVQRTPTKPAWPLSPVTLSPFARSRVGYGIEQLKLVPKMMVEQNCTPWSHAQLYDDYMPRSMQDAHASCALYVAINDRNSPVISQHIRNRAEELIAVSPPSSPLEQLAGAQALILYQLMLFFGADIQSFQLSIDLIPHIEEVTKTTRSLAAEQEDPQDQFPFYPSTAARAAWRSYIFRESLRRTALSLSQVTVMCYLLRGQLQYCDYSSVAGNRLTVSAHLWAATSAFDFAVAWNNKKHFLVKELDFSEVLQDASADDLDDFAKILLISLQGIDDVRGWLHVRGAVL